MNLQEAILNTLTVHGPCARDYLAMLINEPRSTIYDSLERLERMGKVYRRNRSLERPGRGRPIVLWRIVEEETDGF